MAWHFFKCAYSVQFVIRQSYHGYKFWHDPALLCEKKDGDGVGEREARFLLWHTCAAEELKPIPVTEPVYLNL